MLGLGRLGGLGTVTSKVLASSVPSDIFSPWRIFLSQRFHPKQKCLCTESKKNRSPSITVRLDRKQYPRELSRVWQGGGSPSWCCPSRSIPHTDWPGPGPRWSLNWPCLGSDGTGGGDWSLCQFSSRLVRCLGGFSSQRAINLVKPIRKGKE